MLEEVLLPVKKIWHYTGTTWLIAQQHSTISTKSNTLYLRDHTFCILKYKSIEIRICFKVLLCDRGGNLEYRNHCMVSTEFAQLRELFCQLWCSQFRQISHYYMYNHFFFTAPAVLQLKTVREFTRLTFILPGWVLKF